MAITLDSGARQQFETGAQRDTQDDKPRWDLIPLGLLNQLQKLFSNADCVVDDWNPPIVDFEPVEDTRVDLIPGLVINRLGALYKRGADKYDDNNWKKGIPLSRFYSSLFRHFIAWRIGDTSEDHLAAIIWNAAAIMWTEREIFYGRLPSELGDVGPLTNTDMDMI